MIAEQYIDISVISSSTKHRYTDAEEVTSAGSNVLIEKPIDVENSNFMSSIKYREKVDHLSE